MKEAASRRDYRAMDEGYAVLRECYIGVVDRLSESSSGAERENILAVLGEWEAVIEGYREAKEAVSEPLAIDPMMVDPEKAPSADEIEKLDALLSNDPQEQDSFEQERQKAEAQLDDAIERANRFRVAPGDP